MAASGVVEGLGRVAAVTGPPCLSSANIDSMSEAPTFSTGYSLPTYASSLPVAYL